MIPLPGGASIDTFGFQATDAQVVPCIISTAGNTRRSAKMLGTAHCRREIGGDTAILALAGKDLNNTANGVCAIQAGARATNYLNTLNLLYRQILQRRNTRGSRAHTNAIDQHQHVRFAGATNTEGHSLARPTVVGNADTRDAAQYLIHAGRLQALNVGAIKHAGRRNAIGLTGARCGHNLVIQAERIGKGKRRQAAQGQCQRGT